jgi:hypothetical protein
MVFFRSINSLRQIIFIAALSFPLCLPLFGPASAEEVWLPVEPLIWIRSL